MKKFVFIESNTTGTGHLCLQKALLRGFDVLFLTQRPALYGFLQEELVVPVLVDTSDVQQVLAALAAHPQIAGVCSTSEYSLEVAAEVARSLGLPGAYPDAIRTCRNKGLLDQRLRSRNIATAETQIVSDLTQLRDVAATLSYPRVLKPATGSGSVGVRLVHNAAELVQHGAQILAARSNERGQAQAPQALVQAYVQGAEFSIEVIGLGPGQGYEVLGVTGKHLGPLPHFVEYGHDFPAPISAGQRDVLIAETIRALEAVGHRFGPAHVECRWSEGKPVIIEINPRLAGGMIPQAIERATGIDVLDALIDLHSGKMPNLQAQRQGHAAIRFVLPPHPGTLKALDFAAPAHQPEVQFSFKAMKLQGQPIELNGDFRDRLGLVIASSLHADQLASALLELPEHINLVVEPDSSSNTASTGRLRATLHAEAMAIVRKTGSRSERLNELNHFAAIDEAHLLMLIDSGLVDAGRAAKVLQEIAQQQQQGFAAIADAVAPRGTYTLYEQHLISRVGMQAGGLVHTARSRNDINACVARLDARHWFSQCSSTLWRLRAALLDKAAVSQALDLPVYSQYQTAQPGSLAYYLWSVETALRRNQNALHALHGELNQSPLGAGAGAGTDFAIQPGVSAGLLGFSSHFDSALEAVASRDLLLRLLSCLAITATTLSRLAHDLQLWTMRETAFLALPDDLSGSSSIMPQKKNPYLLETVKGKLAHVAGVLNQALFAMQRTPFSNSVEVGTEAVGPCDQAVLAFTESCDLLRLMINGLSADQAAMRHAAEQGLVVAAQVANQLVREQGITFHEAHHQVGAVITGALEAQQDARAALASLTQQPMADVSIARASLKHGGGPGAVAEGLAASRQWLRQSATELWQWRASWRNADLHRQARVARVIADHTAPAMHTQPLLTRAPHHD